MSQHNYTNRLVNETSPYLLQHAHNPVDWYPWGEEALERARRDQKPILLSIGYSACHWCHVMAHESFENPEIAKLMNENFINIKVDREERPDLDQIYMNAVQMLTHHGGWPMTVFLTPEGAPFYGGTYFPPEDRYNMPGFPRVLSSVAQAYSERSQDVAETAASIVSELQRLSATGDTETLTPDFLDAAYQGIIRNYDPVSGGFGGAPKFPPAMTLEFLMHTYHRTEKSQALEVVANTCRKMALGGIYDQLGGGFHRYSTDAKWLVPHFEKMLYDNALLSRLYLHYFQLTHEPFARSIAQGILDYVLREMTDANGGFYSTQDADSEGEEGKFFVWTAEEIEQELGEIDAPLFCAYYNVTREGNFEGRNILNITRSQEEVAAAQDVSIDLLLNSLERGRQKLFRARESRVKPGLDNKILSGWNGLMLASFAEAAAILERAEYLEAARRNARFVLDKMRHGGSLLRTFGNGSAKLNAYLEDYAFYADGLLALYQTTGELEWLLEAVSLTDLMITEFWDSEAGGFFFTGASHEKLIVRSKDYFDNATPSGNSVALDVLLRLAILTGNEEYRERAATMLRLIAPTARRFPSAFGRTLCALDFYLNAPREIAVIGERHGKETDILVGEIWRHYLPNKVVAQASPGDETAATTVPLVRGRRQIDGKATAYVCEHYACKEPVTEPSALRKQLSRASIASPS
ncbi:MAG TPA: thioredoxin domain-containing protein [Pyrinomonadaceae bacterium]|nr:thioredoxin domain-containing protein [Pyrinomonadaceae bacterium]